MTAETDMGGPGVRFGATLWTVILRARDREAPDCRQALEYLIGAYWKPVYFFIRRRGHDIESAKDLTQEFFAGLIGKLDGLERGRGKFRSYLLGAVVHFLSHERDKALAQKRMPVDFAAAETELSARGTAKQAYDRAWALGVIKRATDAMAAERPVWFDALSRHQKGAAYGAIAAAMGLSEADVTNYLHRARRRLAELIRLEVGRTLEDPADLETEVADLFKALKG
jgi:RNA polymerase sigma-70 factor (ECF subfamily)